MIDIFLSNPNRAHSVFLPSDSVTAIFYRTLREKGEDPANYSIVSCNCEKPYLEGLFPKPESIDIHSVEIGKKAAERLLIRLADQNLTTSTILIKPSLN
jgi:DNA-binding LacI/PurR family transcriptional regulator